MEETIETDAKISFFHTILYENVIFHKRDPF